MTEEEAFIRAIVSAPGDDLPRLVYADYLDEWNDPRGAYLRAEVEWAKTKQTTGFLVLRLNGLAEELDPVWVARVSRPPFGVCCDHLKFIDCGPRLTTDDVSAVESRLGVRLPSEFAAFLLNYNAGEVRPAAPAPPGKLVLLCEDIEWGFHPIGDDSDMVAEFERAHRLNLRDLEGDQAAVMRELVPLARVNDDDCLLLGVAGGRNSKVYFFNGHDYDWFHPDGLSKHADSLSRYLATLTAEWVHA